MATTSSFDADPCTVLVAARAGVANWVRSCNHTSTCSGCFNRRLCRIFQRDHRAHWLPRLCNIQRLGAPRTRQTKEAGWTRPNVTFPSILHRPCYTIRPSSSLEVAMERLSWQSEGVVRPMLKEYMPSRSIENKDRNISNSHSSPPAIMWISTPGGV